MIKTGTFLEVSVKTTDNVLISVILGQKEQGYFVCLPDHDGAFELEKTDYIDAANFINYMDGTSAESAATILKQAIRLLCLCGGN